jgi:hypothetical protein
VGRAQALEVRGKRIGERSAGGVLAVRSRAGITQPLLRQRDQVQQQCGLLSRGELAGELVQHRHSFVPAAFANEQSRQFVACSGEFTRFLKGLASAGYVFLAQLVAGDQIVATCRPG